MKNNSEWISGWYNHIMRPNSATFWSWLDRTTSSSLDLTQQSKTILIIFPIFYPNYWFPKCIFCWVVKGILSYKINWKKTFCPAHPLARSPVTMNNFPASFGCGTLVIFPVAKSTGCDPEVTNSTSKLFPPNYSWHIIAWKVNIWYDFTLSEMIWHCVSLYFVLFSKFLMYFLYYTDIYLQSSIAYRRAYMHVYHTHIRPSIGNTGLLSGCTTSFGCR